ELHGAFNNGVGNVKTQKKMKRRIDWKIRLAQVAADICALFAAVGIAVGLYLANDGGWGLPILAGVATGIAFAAPWHLIIGAPVAMVHTGRIAVLFALAAVVTALMLTFSAQGIAQMVAGNAALVRELEGRIDVFSKALDEAYVNGTSWSELADAAN